MNAPQERKDRSITVTNYNPDIHHRQSIRLKGYDYSQAGAYFVTICTNNRECLFGEIVDGAMVANRFGEMVKNVWDDLQNHYPYLELDRFIVMPNHFHGVVVFVGAGVKLDTGKRHGLPEIVRGLKTFSARRINEASNSPGIAVWQRNYYEHVIRGDADYNRIAEYIEANPQRWIEDKLHPDNYVAGENVARRDKVGGNSNIGGDGTVVGAGFKPALRDAADTGGNADLERAGLKPAPTERGTTGRLR